MAVQVTVGDAHSDGGSDDARGAVTVALARESTAHDHRLMIEVVAASGSRHCAAQLTIGEAEVLQTALDSMIFEAAVRTATRAT